MIVADRPPIVKPVIAIGRDSLGRQWYRVECATCIYGGIEGRDAAALEGGRLCLMCEAAQDTRPAQVAFREHLNSDCQPCAGGHWCAVLDRLDYLAAVDDTRRQGVNRGN